MMNFEDNTNDYSDRSGVKSKSTWFSAEDVCILADLVRSHSDALRNLTTSSPGPARNEKKRVWEVIAQLLAEKTNVPRTTRQVQKKWSNLRSAVRRASRSPVGTAVLPHYFLPVLKFLEEENALDGNGSHDNLEEEVEDFSQNVEIKRPTRRQTYEVKIRQIQEQQQVEDQRLSVLRQIKIESLEAPQDILEQEIQHAEESSEVPQEIQFSHVTIPVADTGNDNSYIAQLETQAAASIWVNQGGDQEEGEEQLESEDVDVVETDDVYIHENPGESRTSDSAGPASRKRFRQWPHSEEKKDEETKVKLELLKAQLLLVQKETSLTERKIEKKDKEISLLDKEILKVDLEINFMKRKHKWEEMKMGTFMK